MILLRPIHLLVAVALCLGPWVTAQEGASGESLESGTPAGGESTEGGEAKPKPAEPPPQESGGTSGGTKPPAESQEQKPAGGNENGETKPNPFMEGLGNPFGTGAGASTAFGSSTTEEGAEQIELQKEKPVETEETSSTLKPSESQAAETFSAPGLYGSGSVSFTAGEGRLAKPRFRYSGTIGLGYDDNYLLAPTKQVIVPEQTFFVVTDFGSPEIFALEEVQETVNTYGPNQDGQTQTTTTLKKVVIQPARDPEFTEVVIPEFRGLERESSFVTEANLSFDVQWAKRRTLFVFDLNIGADYYWSRKTDPTQYNGSMSFNYIHRFNPRTQFSAAGSMTYSAQPDYSALVGSTISNSGSYLAGSVKADLSHRWMRRISTLTSLSMNMLTYEEESRSFGNYQEFTLGNEFRYQWSPRLTTLVELRYSTQDYPEAPTLKNNTFYALIGTDWQYSRRLGTTLRIGQATKTFEGAETEAEAQTTPYMELSINYRLGPRTQISWNNRYGFEQNSTPGTEVVSYRSNMNFSHAFSPRFRGNMGISYTKQTFDTPGVELANNTTYIDGNLGLQYVVNRNFVLGMRYSYSQQITTQEVQDYYRNRLFFTASFEY